MNNTKEIITIFMMTTIIILSTMSVFAQTTQPTTTLTLKVYGLNVVTGRTVVYEKTCTIDTNNLECKNDAPFSVTDTTMIIESTLSSDQNFRNKELTKYDVSTFQTNPENCDLLREDKTCETFSTITFGGKSFNQGQIIAKTEIKTKNYDSGCVNNCNSQENTCFQTCSTQDFFTCLNGCKMARETCVQNCPSTPISGTATTTQPATTTTTGQPTTTTTQPQTTSTTTTQPTTTTDQPATTQPSTVSDLIITPKTKCGTPIRNAKPNLLLPHAVCQPFAQWQFVTDENNTIEKNNPFGSNEANIPVKFSQQCDKEFHTTGCCPATKCWDGKTCASNGAFFDAGPTGYGCDNGNWQAKPKKYNFNRQMVGFCPQDQQCLVSSVGNANFDNQPAQFFKATGIAQQPRCITNTQYLKDEYCDDGNWTTRTKLLATQLLSLAENLNIPEYDLFCDSYDNVLNNVRYSYEPGQSMVENFIKENCVKEGRIVPCANNFCILKTINGVSAIATSLNTPINSSLSFLKALNLSENDCDNALTTTQFTKCTPTKTIPGEVWFNPNIESVIYLPPQIQTSLTDIYTQPRFKTVIEYVATKHIAELPDRNFSFFNQTRLFNKLMYSKKGPRAIFAFLEQNQLLPPLSYLGITYTNFSLGTDPCLLFKTALTRPVCEKQINNSDFVLIAKDNQLPTWRDLTAKLRLVAGPPRQITTDTGATPPPPRQLQTRDQCL